MCAVAAADRPIINELEVDYARFNALKTIATSEPSRFEHRRFGGLDVTRDGARADSYYNRVLGLTPETAAELDAAISWIWAGTSADQLVRIDTSVGDGASQETPGPGFRHVDTLVWMAADPADNDLPASKDVRPLTATDWPALRGLLEERGPIADNVWYEKRNYLCTDTFRWFGVFERELLISAASTWMSGSVAIFGSAFTRQAWRHRGHQRQLLEERRRLTPGRPFVDVEPESTSHRNCLRVGFNDLDYRHVWETIPAT